ncbi:hypothetical protein [Ekhidna sp.]|jgi:hypothetical protein|uniref:hypothetical protein n=1 Tax=Ekhidna sp. TaxID=2608089 RepID=UPI0032EAA616
MKTLYNSIKTLSLLLGFSTLLFITSCGGGDDGDTAPDDANAYLNENISLPAGSFTVSADQVTETNDVVVQSSGSGSTMQVVGGQQVNVSIPFTAANSNVTHAGMRFGDSGDIIMIPIPAANGNSSGTLDFTFGIPADICENLNDICHDIRCYEFAVTSDGSGGQFQVSRANINQLASACGGCDEPQCVALLGENCGAAGGDGSPRFNLTWDNTSVDLDFYVTDPAGETLGYGQGSTSTSGGEWDYDCTGDDCTAENITWADGGPSGTYTYYINYFGGTGTANWQIRVFDGGRVVGSQSGSLSTGQSTTYSYTR